MTISKLAFNEDAEGIALLLTLMMAEIDMLRTELFNLKGDE